MGSMQQQTAGPLARATIAYSRHEPRRLAFCHGRVQDSARGDWEYVAILFGLTTDDDFRRAQEAAAACERRLRNAGDPAPKARSPRRRRRVAEKARIVAADLGWALSAGEEAAIARMEHDATRQSGGRR